MKPEHASNCPRRTAAILRGKTVVRGVVDGRVRVIGRIRTACTCHLSKTARSMARLAQLHAEGKA